MRRLVLPLLLVASIVSAQEAEQLPTAEELLAAADRNLVFESRTATVTMTVEGKRRDRTMKMVSYGRGQDDSAMEYTEPAREKGTRMLKIGDELWMYMPSVDRVQKISGHMLRQGMMGSDVSYEDLMASRALQTAYDAQVTGAEQVDGRKCWKLELKARDESVAYPKRVSWIDVETMIPVRQELYALSGMLLKTWTMSDIKEFGGRKFPTRMEITDVVKQEGKTIMTFDDLQFGVTLPDEVFSMRWLERK